MSNKKQRKEAVIKKLLEGQNWRTPVSNFQIQKDDMGYFVTDKAGRRKKLVVDHDHETGIVRSFIDELTNLLLDQWEHYGSYGELSEPIEFEQYRLNPPALKIIGKVDYDTYKEINDSIQ